jgi:threonyl-tRNA synthetase
LQILDGIKSETITIYHIGNKWWDLCAGPHVSSTGKLDSSAIEIESIAGAYWKGDVESPVLQV